MELPHIGSNCEFHTCNQLDFLPFQCDGCGKTFCLHHRSRDQHNCTAPEAQVVEFAGERSYPCTINECSNRELTPIICHHCELSFCMSHRLQEDHSCVKLPKKAARTSKTAEHVQQILAQSNVQPRKVPTNPKAIHLNAKISLMKLKGKALGDQGIPQNERIYFNIFLPQEVKKPPCALFFSKVWKIGRVIDVIADKVSITNRNNTSFEKKLCLFHADTGVKLPTGQSLVEIMNTEDYLLLNGSSLILEQVPVSVDQLENVAIYKI
ncbi:AN1-type zinc finger protein 1 [Bulinus truncatus]|nr:AN1-type zinc finger protein 1 [Bulinus truncatus]